MAAVWIILAKTRFPAELIESSKEHGVRTASVPFDISAEFLPDLLYKPDRDLERLSAGLSPEAPEFVDIIHRSAIMKRVVSQSRLVAPRSVSVLIEGESGTGKELLARAIHRASPRRDKPFVSVNCGAIPSELVEAELFGYVKGAFSGATRSHAGYFEKASTGTLFLDEIGELSLAAQVKILRVLQEKEVTRLGSTSPVLIDVRLLAATNRKLVEEVANGRFRTDLFYRLAVAVLQLPPLRERPGDIGLLIDRLLDQINEESVHEPGFFHKKLSVSAKNLLLKHHWPGNVRELFNTLLRSAIWSSGTTINSNDVASAISPVAAVQSSEILNRHLGEGLNLPEIISTVARHYLSRAMEESHGNKTKATELLGMPSYQTLTNWLKKYGLE
jgi:transcriptional regulator with PAS, ATPase and Fis domain